MVILLTTAPPVKRVKTKGGWEIVVRETFGSGTLTTKTYLGAANARPESGQVDARYGHETSMTKPSKHEDTNDMPTPRGRRRSLVSLTLLASARTRSATT